METIEEKIENIEEKIEKKVVFDEEQNTEKIIEDLLEDEDNNVMNEDQDNNVMNQDQGNNDVINEEENLVELEQKIIAALMKSIEISVSRGVYTPQEIANVGKVINEFNSQIKIENDKIMISKFKKISINNFRILMEISISRGGYQINELADIGDLYNYIRTLL